MNMEFSIQFSTIYIYFGDNVNYHYLHVIHLSFNKYSIKSAYNVTIQQR